MFISQSIFNYSVSTGSSLGHFLSHRKLPSCWSWNIYNWLGFGGLGCVAFSLGLGFFLLFFLLLSSIQNLLDKNFPLFRFFWSKTFTLNFQCYISETHGNNGWEKTKQREFAPGPRSPGRLFLVISKSSGSIQAVHQKMQLEIGAMMKAEKTSFNNVIH